MLRLLNHHKNFYKKNIYKKNIYKIFRSFTTNHMEYENYNSTSKLYDKLRKPIGIDSIQNIILTLKKYKKNIKL